MTASVFECTFVVVEYVQPAPVVECGAPPSTVIYCLCSHLLGTCSRGRVCCSPVTYAAPVPEVVCVTPVVYDVARVFFKYCTGNSMLPSRGHGSDCLRVWKHICFEMSTNWAVCSASFFYYSC